MEGGKGGSDGGRNKLNSMTYTIQGVCYTRNTPAVSASLMHNMCCVCVLTFCASTYYTTWSAEWKDPGLDCHGNLCACLRLSASLCFENRLRAC